MGLVATRSRRGLRGPGFAAALCAAGLACAGTAAAQSGAFALPEAGCPMAHCDARMSDLVNAQGPAQGVAVRIEKSGTGANNGLGCVSNLTLVACTGSGDPAVESNLVVYDADGHRIWQDPGHLGATAWVSAPMIDVDGQVIAADKDWILRADPRAGIVLWRTAKPDAGVPTSPVPVGSGGGMVLLATLNGGGGTPEVSVWDAASGALLAHRAIIDAASGRIYATINTPAVRGNRAYVLTSAVGNPKDGRLYAIDVCEGEACGGRGALRIAWHHAFNGPSAASPLLIGSRLFFDGRRSLGASTFLAVDDLGATAQAAWTQRFSGRFAFSAAQDPRGGLWVAPWESGTFLRLSEGNGAVIQSLAVGALLGLSPAYTPSTATSVSRSAAGAVVLTFGAQANNASASPAWLAALDVSSTPEGRLLWKYRVSSNALRNAPTGQTPVVVAPSGARRVVFRGTTASTFFVGDP